MPKRGQRAKPTETSVATTAAESLDTTNETQQPVEEQVEETTTEVEAEAPADTQESEELAAESTEPESEGAAETTEATEAEDLVAQAVAAEAALDAAVTAATESVPAEPVYPHSDKSPVVQTLLSVVDDYMAHMDTNVFPADETGKAIQRRFYRTVRTIIELPESKDFIDAMRYLIDVVRSARGPQRAFNENRVFRFYEHGIFNATEGRAAETLISFIIQMADGFKGQALNSALKTMTTAHVLSDTVAQRLGSFAQRYTSK